MSKNLTCSSTEAFIFCTPYYTDCSGLVVVRSRINSSFICIILLCCAFAISPERLFIASQTQAILYSISLLNFGVHCSRRVFSSGELFNINAWSVKTVHAYNLGSLKVLPLPFPSLRNFLLSAVNEV